MFEYFKMEKRLQTDYCERAVGWAISTNQTVVMHKIECMQRSSIGERESQTRSQVFQRYHTIVNYADTKNTSSGASDAGGVKLQFFTDILAYKHHQRLLVASTWNI